ncbi:ABC transporter permease [Caldalkalibacillus mannanilyticus]|uniref:ABC transporter permease n=1 Tax=Caldalkalibacillus mannanilyticus TaxID=1418 RepID=UPI0011DCFEC7|nr:FtsX-like permease family protein [Caldalkalibacillus mannanilyticus]
MEYSVRKSADENFGAYDLIVGYETIDKTLSESDVEYISHLSGVKESAPILFPYIGDRMLDMETYPMYIGMRDVPLSQEFEHYRLAKGTFPKNGEVALSKKYMIRNNIDIGSTIRMDFPSYGIHEVRVSGELVDIERMRNERALFHIDWLQEITKNPDQATALMLSIDKGVSKEEIHTQIKYRFPDIEENLQIEKDMELESLGGMKPMIQVLSAITIFSSLFIVVSTLQISVHERQKEYAVIRLIGAFKKQISRMVMFESLFIGVCGSVMGMIMSLGITYLFKGPISLFLGLEATAMIVPWNMLLLSGVLGIVVTIIAGMFPSYLASKVLPLEALQMSKASIATQNTHIPFWYPILLTFFIVVSSLTHYYLQQTWLTVSMIVVLFTLFFFGIRHLLVLIIKMLSTILQRVWKTDGWIAKLYVLKHVKRNVKIVGVLMLASIVAINGVILLLTVYFNLNKDLEQEFPFEMLITTVEGNKGGFSGSILESIHDLEGVSPLPISSYVMAMIKNLSEVEHKREASDISITLGMTVVGVDLKTLLEHFPITAIEGDMNKVFNGGVIISREDAEKFGYGIGDEIELSPVFLESESTRLEVTAIVEEFPLYSKSSQWIFTDISTIERVFNVDALHSIHLKFDSNYDQEKLKEQVYLIQQHPEASNIIIYDRVEEMSKVFNQVFQRILILCSAIAVLVLIVLLGLSNNMAASIRERVTEFSIMRVLGSPNRQILRLLLMEGGILTFAGTIIGITAGIILGCQLIAILESPISYSFLLWFLVPIIISPFVGLFVSLFPALWLIRLDPNATLKVE